ncbi:MAG: hypothetical protein FJ146_11360 [Deltaproteobacteria bacterium]|nr:hypothetical protein [Deltaproteobacteria bacterium]
MILETIPIEVFVVQKYNAPEVQKLVEHWRIEPETIMKNVIEHFRELGIFGVPMAQQVMMLDAMRTYLRTSPEITRMVMKSEQEEAIRARTKHAE